MGLETERDRVFSFSVDMLCVAELDGLFKQVNPAWTSCLGWSSEELLGRPWLELVHHDDRERTRQGQAPAEALFQARAAFKKDGHFQDWMDEVVCREPA